MSELTKAMFEGTGLEILGIQRQRVHPGQPPSTKFEVHIVPGQQIDYAALDAHLEPFGYVTDHTQRIVLSDQDGDYAWGFIVMYVSD